VGRSNINRGRARREELRADAEQRRDHRASLSNAQQIERLNALLGEGTGAKRERARLEKEMEVEAEMRKRTKSKSKASGSTREGDKRKARERRRGATTNE
jgi:hypothetical protein